MVLEWVNHGNLLDYCRLQGMLDESLVVHISTQLINALHYIHSWFLCHRDIKCENILISCRNPMTVKLADFGFCKFLGPMSRRNTRSLRLVVLRLKKF